MSGISDLYDLTASRYDSLVNRRFYQDIAAVLLDGIDPEIEIRTILEVGAGTGFSTSLLRERYPAADITALEPSPAMTALGRARAPDVEWHQTTVAEFEPRPFDLIFSSMSYHWLTAVERGMLAGMAAEGLTAIGVSVNDRTHGSGETQDGNKMLRQAVAKLRPEITWSRRDRHADLLSQDINQYFPRIAVTRMEDSEIFSADDFADILYVRGSLSVLFGERAHEAHRTLKNAAGTSGHIVFNWSFAMITARR